MAAVVFATSRVIPFDTQPRTFRARDFSDESHSAKRPIVGHSLPDAK